MSPKRWMIGFLCSKNPEMSSFKCFFVTWCNAFDLKFVLKPGEHPSIKMVTVDNKLDTYLEMNKLLFATQNTQETKMQSSKFLFFFLVSENQSLKVSHLVFTGVMIYYQPKQYTIKRKLEILLLYHMHLDIGIDHPSKNGAHLITPGEPNKLQWKIPPFLPILKDSLPANGSHRATFCQPSFMTRICL